MKLRNLLSKKKNKNSMPQDNNDNKSFLDVTLRKQWMPTSFDDIHKHNADEATTTATSSSCGSLSGLSSASSSSPVFLPTALGVKN